MIDSRIACVRKVRSLQLTSETRSSVTLAVISGRGSKLGIHFGTLVNGTKHENLRFPGALNLTHTQVPQVQKLLVFSALSGGYLTGRRSPLPNNHGS